LFPHSFLMTSRIFCALLLVINYLLVISWIYLLLSRIKTSRSISYQNCILHEFTLWAWLSNTSIYQLES
jgi:hypothetical protein